MTTPSHAATYLHYVFDLWVQHWRKTKAKGDVIVVRWADDFVVGLMPRDCDIQPVYGTCVIVAGSGHAT